MSRSLRILSPNLYATTSCSTFLLRLSRRTGVLKTQFCIVLHVDMEDSSHLVFYEIWRDSAAIDAFQFSETFQNMVDEAMPATESVNIYRLRPITE